jgi:hypothetical protein
MRAETLQPEHMFDGLEDVCASHNHWRTDGGSAIVVRGGARRSPEAWRLTAATLRRYRRAASRRPGQDGRRSSGRFPLIQISEAVTKEPRHSVAATSSAYWSGIWVQWCGRTSRSPGRRAMPSVRAGPRGHPACLWWQGRSRRSSAGLRETRRRSAGPRIAEPLATARTRRNIRRSSRCR